MLVAFGESSILRLIEGVPPVFQPGRALIELEDSPEGRDDLFRVRGLNDSWRAERRQPASAHFCFLTDLPDPRLTPFQARLAPPHHHGPGCEHAYRNGCGGPLLC
jgi:hypothetical protein